MAGQPGPPPYEQAAVDELVDALRADSQQVGYLLDRQSSVHLIASLTEIETKKPLQAARQQLGGVH